MSKYPTPLLQRIIIRKNILFLLQEERRRRIFHKSQKPPLQRIIRKNIFFFFSEKKKTIFFKSKNPFLKTRKEKRKKIFFPYQIKKKEYITTQIQKKNKYFSDKEIGIKYSQIFFYSQVENSGLLCLNVYRCFLQFLSVFYLFRI